MDVEKLIRLFQSTHLTLQKRAARSVDNCLVVRNWLFGWYIVEFEQNGEDRAEYGKKLLKEISIRLKHNIGRGFSVDNLELFRRFYLKYQNDVHTFEKTETMSGISNKLISETVSRISEKTEITSSNSMDRFINTLFLHFNLGWSHYVALLTLNSIEERKFYEIESIENSWSVRELQRQINSSLYERLLLSKDKKKVKELSQKGQIIEKPQDVIKNPFVLEFLNLPEYPHYSEHQLETAVIDKLELFLLELGKGFLFESRQKRFSFDNRHFYVDLVFYNRLLKCFVVIDLKIGDLKHQDLGQMQMYVNYFDRYVKTEEENQTVGILLCLTKSDSLVELTLPKESNIYASNYQLYLPSKEELKEQVKEAEKEFVKKQK